MSIKSDFIINTPNLQLKCLNLNDWDDMMELRTNPANSPFNPDDIWKSEKDAKDFFDFATLFYDDNPSQPNWFRYFFAIREHGNDKVIGICGIGAPDFDRSITEVFYGLTNTKWNKGFATEATKAMLNLGFNQINLDRIIGFINPNNIGSSRVLEKSGLKEIGILDNIPIGHDCFGNTLFEITRDEYIRKQNRLIFVEGLPGTGKSTLSNWIFELLINQGKQVELLLEDDARLPSNFCNIAGIPQNIFLDLIIDESQIAAAILARTDNFIFINLSKCTESIARQLKCWDIGDEYNKFISVQEYARCALEWWQNWVKNYTNESIFIMDSAFMQNPINEMIFRGATNLEVEAYIYAIAELMKPLYPVCIYLRRGNATESISFAKAAKGNNWAEGVDRALLRLNCPDLFERRYDLEFSFLSSMAHVACDVNGNDWTNAKKRILDYFY